MRAMGKDCALGQVELEILCHEFSDEALEIQAVPEGDQPMRNTTLYYNYCTAVFFLSWSVRRPSIAGHMFFGL